MTITLITGANKGLGYETARRLAAAGHTVYAAARDERRGRAAAADLGLAFVRLDVTDDASVAAAAGLLREREGRLDVLVNNAGIGGGFRPPAEVTAADMLRVYDTNVFGVVRVTVAMLPLLERADAPAVVNVSSGMGSFAVTTDPRRLEHGIVGLAYPSSKAALNMVTTQMAKAWPWLRVNAVDPGYTATDLNGRRGHQSVEQGATAVVDRALSTGRQTGGFFDATGPVPW